jgi:DNA helicase-4
MVDGTSSSKTGLSARPALKKALQDIARRSEGKPRDVLVLGRYNHIWDGKQEIVNRIYKDAPNLRIRFLTVHKSKGLEADYVIVADVNKGKYGFPCEITDDPVLDLVLSHAEQYENAEERRLFYVALTRTRNDVYLLATDGMLSDFIVELEEDKGYAVDFIDRPNQMKLERCSKCGIGRLEVHEGRFGRFRECRLCGYNHEGRFGRFRECRLCGYKPGKLRR